MVRHREGHSRRGCRHVRALDPRVEEIIYVVDPGRRNYQLKEGGDSFRQWGSARRD